MSREINLCYVLRDHYFLAFPLRAQLCTTGRLCNCAWLHVVAAWTRPLPDILSLLVVALLPRCYYPPNNNLPLEIGLEYLSNTAG